MAIQPWRTGKVIRIENATYNTRRYWIEIPELTSFDFVPGQFVQLDFPIHEKPAKRWRSYSIASWPDGTNVLELVIVLVEDGAGTPWLFNNVEVGSEIPVRGPQGVFTLHEENLQKDLFLVCTGTGIAPFRAMVHHISRHNIAHGNIYVIFGCRTQNDLLYYDELRGLELENYHYIPTLSREEWVGKKGYVHAIYEEHCAGKQNAGFFLCGWKNMIEEAKRYLLEIGYEKKDIHYEIYG